MVPMRLEIAQTGAFLAATRTVMAMMQADNGTVVKLVEMAAAYNLILESRSCYL